MIVRKEMFMESKCLWRDPPSMNIYVREYQLIDVAEESTQSCFKRRLLCGSTYHFFEDTDEDRLQKCQLTIVDERKKPVFQKVYSQIDRINRKFYTLQ